jgi:hypothetical protein
MDMALAMMLVKTTSKSPSRYGDEDQSGPETKIMAVAAIWFMYDSMLPGRRLFFCIYIRTSAKEHDKRVHEG